MNDSTLSQVIHDIDNNRFVLSIGEKQVEARYRMVDSSTIEFYSTYTPPQLRGNGYAGRVVNAALEHAKKNDFNIIATCQYVKSKL